MSVEEESSVSMFRGDKLPFPPELHASLGKDALSVHEWVDLMREHLMMRDIPLNSAKAVHFACLFLRGNALTWKRSLGAVFPKSFDKWAELLTKALAPVNEQLRAVHKLERLQQRHSLAAYADEFARTCLLIPDDVKSKVDKVCLFVDGCKPHLREKLRPAMIGHAGDLDLAKELAISFDEDFQAEWARERRLRGNTGSLKPITNSPNPRGAPPSHSSGGLRLCFTCGSTDHLRDRCPRNADKGTTPARKDQQAGAKKYGGGGGSGGSSSANA